MATGITTYANEGSVVAATTIGNANITTSIHHGNIISNPQPETEPIRINVKSPEINFVGRLLELSRLEGAMQTPPRSSARKAYTIVVSGLGGIGKTQLVRKFVENNRSLYKNVIWIDSERSELINESFNRLAEKLNIPIINANGKVKNIEFVIEDVLNKLSKNKTLFVYDNVEKIQDIKFALTVQQIEDQCHVIITTRLQEWGSEINVISVKVWSIEDAVKYVSQTLNNSDGSNDDRKLIVDSDEDITLLVEKLQYFPLALRQATAYITYQRMEQSFKIADYLAKYDKQEMLDSNLFQKSICSGYEKTTFTTWSVTIEAIKKDIENGSLAVRILYIISYFDPDNIYRDIFTHLMYRKKTSFIEFISNVLNCRKLSPATHNEQNIRSAVRLLVNYSMVDRYDSQQSVLSIHRLVQLVIKVKCEESHRDEITLQDALSLFRNLIEINHEKLNSSLTHFCSVFITALIFPNLVKEFSALPSEILRRLHKLSRYNEAKAFGDAILHSFIDILGEDDSNTLITKSEIAYSYREVGSHINALQMYQEVFEKEKKILGEDDLETLQSKYEIAFTYREQGLHTKAIEIYQDIFDKQKNILGEDDVETLKTKSNIAFSYGQLRKYTQALQMHQEVFEKRKNLLGENHPQTLVSKFDIAYSYRQLGKHTDALQIYEEVLEIRKILLGENHPDTLRTKSNMAYSYRALGNLIEALHLYQEVFEKEKNIIGEDHPETILTKHEIAFSYRELGDYATALQMYQELLETSINIFGLDHPSTLLTKVYVASSYRQLGNLTEALKMYEEVFEKQTHIIGGDHPDTLSTQAHIAYTYRQLGNHPRALQMYQEAFEKMKNILIEEDHQQILISKADIASSCVLLGNHSEALQMYEEVFDEIRKMFSLF